MSYVLFPATLKPTGLFSTHEDIFGKGGFVSLTGGALTEESSIQDFLNTNIIEQRRKLGMLVYISSIKRYYTCSSVTGEAGISGDWDRQYFSGRYFHGPSAPTEQDIQIGERWFDTIAGTEYTYIPIQEGSDQYAWVDIDHIGRGGRYFHGPSAPTEQDIQIGERWFDTIAGTEYTYIPIQEGSDQYAWVDIDHIGRGGGGSMIYFYGNDAPTVAAPIGSKWFNTKLGAELTLLLNEPDNGGETGTVWVMVNSLASGASGNYVLKTGDTMTGALVVPFVTMTQGLTSSSGFIRTLTGTNASFTGLTATNGFIGTLTGTNASFIGLTATNGFIGTLTGTNASFTGLTATNGFIGTLTGNNIRYTNAEFGTESLVIQGSSATFTNMSVMITGDSTFVINDLSIGTTFSANVLNQNVYRIFADDGVALGGNTPSENNWLGNNVFLTPQEDHSVMIGFPTSTPVDDSYAKLVVTGGIITKRIFSIGSEYSGITAFQNGVNFENIASAAAFGITTVDGYEHPLLSVQDRQSGGWVNAPKIRRVWPTGSTGAKSRTDDFESNEYVTKSYVDNNAMLRDSEANPNVQKWRILRFSDADDGDAVLDYPKNGGETFTIEGPKDLGFGNPYNIEVTRIPIRSDGAWSSNTATFRSYGLTNDDTIVLEYKVVGSANANPPANNRVVFPGSSDTNTKVTIATNTSNPGLIFIVNITPGS